jgi:DNA-binding response OmpR family regulator
MMRCLCCGQEVFALDLDALIVAARLTRLEARILEALAGAKGNYLSSYALAEKIYFDDIDGGPSAVAPRMSQMIYSMRSKMAHLEEHPPFFIESHFGYGFRVGMTLNSKLGAGGGYRLERTA